MNAIKTTGEAEHMKWNKEDSNSINNPYGIVYDYVQWCNKQRYQNEKLFVT